MGSATYRAARKGTEKTTRHIEDHPSGGGRTLRALRSRKPMPQTATCHGQTL
jgi:hypothetical protein